MGCSLPECKNDEDKIKGRVSREHYTSGNLKEEIPYKNGKVDGIVKKYSDGKNTKLYEEIPLKKVNINDDFILQRETPFVEDKRKEYITKNEKLEEENSYKNDKQEGVLISQTPYLEGKKHGIEQRYHRKNGKLIRELSYKNDVLEGVGKWYYDENGKVLWEVPYKNNKKRGRWKNL